MLDRNLNNYVFITKPEIFSNTKVNKNTQIICWDSRPIEMLKISKILTQEDSNTWMSFNLMGQNTFHRHYKQYSLLKVSL